jgi:oligopeptide transport system ATP-binding protein
VRPSAGTIHFAGADLASIDAKGLRETRRRMQMIFQDPYSSLDPRMRVGASIGEPLGAYGVAKGAEQRARVAALMERVGLSRQQIDRYPHQFSGGQRQRLVIARALALEPELIVCDEPVSALDVSVRSQILNLLIDLQREFHATYLFISHDLSVVRHISDRIAVMYLGRVVELAERDTLFAHALHPYTQALMSAIPLPSPREQRQRKRIILTGETPSPANMPPGCAFHTRCPIATDICRRATPLLERKSTGAEVACHLAS